MKFKKISKIFAGTLAIAMLLVSCSNSNNETTGETGTTTENNSFIYAIDGDPGNSVNVITTNDRYGLMTIKAIYSPLYMYNVDGISYFLAESMTPSEDKLTYTAKLREGVKWSDGTPFTADDVVFTYNEMLKEENAGSAYSQLIFNGKPLQVNKVDDLTVEFILPEVSAPAMESLGGIYIMPKHIYEGETNFANSTKNATPVGTGPYVLDEYKSGQYVKFVKNENYFLDTAEIDEVYFRIVPDANTAKLALQKGEVHALSVQSSDLADLVTEDSNLTAYAYEEGRVGNMILNANSSKLQNADFRKAIFYGINRTDIINAAYGSEEYADPAYSFLPNANEFNAKDSIEKYEYNPEKAKELLASSGVTGVTLKFGYQANNVPQQRQAAIIQQNLKEIGINVELAAGEPNAIYQQMENADTDYDMFLNGYIMGIDPDKYNALFISTSPSNFMHSNNPEVDRLFDLGRVETDTAKRQEIYTEIQKIIQDDAYFFPLLENKRIVVINSSIKGVEDAKLVPIYTFEDMSKLYFE